MPKSVQLRNVPDELHAELKARAKEAGVPLGAFVVGELERLTRGPEPEEPVAPPPPPRRPQAAPPQAPVQPGPEDAAAVMARMRGAGVDKPREMPVTRRGDLTDRRVRT